MYKEMKITSPIKRTESARLFEASKTFFPGGVNSPVRAFKSVGGTPLFIKKGNGALIWDEDDNEFIDFCLYGFHFLPKGFHLGIFYYQWISFNNFLSKVFHLGFFI